MSIQKDRSKLGSVLRDIHHRVLVLGENMGLDREVLRTKVLLATSEYYNVLRNRRLAVVADSSPYEDYSDETEVLRLIDAIQGEFPDLGYLDAGRMVGVDIGHGGIDMPTVCHEYRLDMSRVRSDVIYPYAKLYYEGTPAASVVKTISVDTGLSVLLSRLLAIELLKLPVALADQHDDSNKGRRDLPLAIPSPKAVERMKFMLSSGVPPSEAALKLCWNNYEIFPYVGVYSLQEIPDAVRSVDDKTLFCYTQRATRAAPKYERSAQGKHVVQELPKNNPTGTTGKGDLFGSVGGLLGVGSGIAGAADKYVEEAVKAHEQHCGVNETLRIATMARAEAIGAASRKDTVAAEEARCVWKQAVMDLDLMGFDFDAAQDVLEDDDKWKDRMAAATTHESKWSRFKRWCRQWL